MDAAIFNAEVIELVLDGIIKDVDLAEQRTQLARVKKENECLEAKIETLQEENQEQWTEIQALKSNLERTNGKYDEDLSMETKASREAYETYKAELEDFYEAASKTKQAQVEALQRQNAELTVDVEGLTCATENYKRYTDCLQKAMLKQSRSSALNQTVKAVRRRGESLKAEYERAKGRLDTERSKLKPEIAELKREVENVSKEKKVKIRELQAEIRALKSFQAEILAQDSAELENLHRVLNELEVENEDLKLVNKEITDDLKALRRRTVYGWITDDFDDVETVEETRGRKRCLDLEDGENQGSKRSKFE